MNQRELWSQQHLKYCLKYHLLCEVFPKSQSRMNFSFLSILIALWLWVISTFITLEYYIYNSTSWKYIITSLVFQWLAHLAYSCCSINISLLNEWSTFYRCLETLCYFMYKQHPSIDLVATENDKYIEIKQWLIVNWQSTLIVFAFV